MTDFRRPAIPRDQITLWADRLDDALPADHSVRIFDELFTQVPFREALAELEAEQRQREGAPGYSPASLAKLHIYGQMVRIRSSRQLEQACINRLDVIWLVEGQKPDHATIARFVGRHQSRLKGLLKASIGAAMSAGLVTLETVGIDGTFIEANASRKSVKKKDAIEAEMAELDAVIEKLSADYQQNDEIEGKAAEAGVLGVPDRTLPPDRRRATFEAKRARMQEAVKTIEARADAARRSDLPAPKPIASTTDPDARHMRDKEHRRKPNYNAQMAVDGKAGVIVATSVNSEPNDMGQMIPMLVETKENCEAIPACAVLDAGYHTGRDVAKLESLSRKPETEAVTESTTEAATEMAPENETLVGEVFVTDPKIKRYEKAAEAREILAAGGSLSSAQVEALPRNKAGCFDHVCFVYDEPTNSFRCPAGESLTPARGRTREDRHGPIKGTEYRTTACATCRLASACHQSKTGRSVSRTEFDDARERMLRRVMSEEGKVKGTKRSTTAEPRFGEVKGNVGFRKFLRRGLSMVNAEFDLIATALNISKIIKHSRHRKKPEPLPT